MWHTVYIVAIARWSSLDNPNIMAQQWTCTVCNRTMQLGSQASHLAGQPHANQLASQSNPGQSSAGIPIQAYHEAGVKPSRRRAPSAKEIQAASDAWDARGILHDIDTQWGLIPGGGAYKESNHYYGAGEYDFD